MKSMAIKLFFLSLTMILSVYNASAQCVMCRTAIENDKDVAEGVNNGILYLMGIPYIILAVTLYFILKHRRERRAEGKE